MAVGNFNITPDRERKVNFTLPIYLTTTSLLFQGKADYYDMMKNMVNPILVERMGGIKITKVQVLRTCSVGESNLDRAIGDLMLLKNPTVGLAAHTGQTDVRITAKADSHEEADKLITKMELQLRERLGISIYGMGKETVPDVVGKLLKEKGL